MTCRISVGLSLAAAALLGLTTTADARALLIAPTPKPGATAANADVILIGKVAEIEPDTVEATPYKGAPKDQRLTYKVAVVKLEESLSGGKGLTQFRVAFPSDAGGPAGGGPGGLPGGRPIRPVRGGGPVALTVGQEGVFFLSSHHAGFYVLTNDGTAPVLDKKNENYKKELDEVKKVLKVFEEPVAALKAKELGDRYNAAVLLLQRYQTPKGGAANAREAIPTEENKLIVALMAELPWQPDMSKPRLGSDPMPPNRMTLWNSINPNDLGGFKQPNFNAKPGDAPVDFNKVLDEATAKHLKENADKIKIKRYSR